MDMSKVKLKKTMAMGKMQSGGMAKKKMAHGGGIQTQGKTRGKMVNMKHGGKA